MPGPRGCAFLQLNARIAKEYPAGHKSISEMRPGERTHTHRHAEMRPGARTHTHKHAEVRPGEGKLTRTNMNSPAHTFQYAPELSLIRGHVGRGPARIAQEVENVLEVPVVARHRRMVLSPILAFLMGCGREVGTSSSFGKGTHWSYASCYGRPLNIGRIPKVRV